MTNTTIDYFLGQSLIIEQPKNGYRAGIDAVLLAAAVAAKDNNNIAELGCGVGTALLSSIARNKNIKAATGFEIDEAAFTLAQKNIFANKIENIEVHNLDGLIPNSIHENKFDLVFSNPPFFDDDKSIRVPNEEKTRAYIIGAPLLNWIKAMLRFCSAKGEILIIHRADRMYDILNALEKRAGDVRILMIHPKTGENANRVIIRAKKASKAPLQILPPLFLRDADNFESYFDEINQMCNGAELAIFKSLYV